MSDKDITTAVETTATEPTVPVMIHAQYIKDLSFENPLAPESLRAGKSQPEMDIDIQMESNPVKDEKLKNLYEVVLKLSATAKRDGEVAFIAGGYAPLLLNPVDFQAMYMQRFAKKSQETAA